MAKFKAWWNKNEDKYPKMSIETLCELAHRDGQVTSKDTDRLNALESGMSVYCHHELADNGEWVDKCYCDYGIDQQQTGSSMREAIDNAIIAQKSSIN